ncbi:MAG: hypothetical protein ACI92B_000133 [Marinobacter maritimus]|jgi:hypothetical protein
MGDVYLFSWKNNSLRSDIFSGETKFTSPMPRLAQCGPPVLNIEKPLDKTRKHTR